MGGTPTKAALVVHLSISRNSQRLPDMHQKGRCLCCSPPRCGLSGRITRDHINGIEASKPLSSSQKVGNDVHLAQVMRFCRLQVWINQSRLLTRLTLVGHA